MHAVLTRARAAAARRLWWPAWLQASRAAARGHFIAWLPVLMGTGVVTYVARRDEPPLWLGAALRLLAAAPGSSRWQPPTLPAARPRSAHRSTD